MPAAKKTTRKRATRKKKTRQAVQKLGLVIAEACREAARELPDATPDERREWCVELLNEKLDVPILTENQESVLLSLCVDVACDIIFKQRYGGHRKELNVAKELVAKLRS
jgi:hypothetical protein